MEKIFDLKERSYQFGISVIKLVKILPKNTAAFVIGDQLIRCGMSIGANKEVQLLLKKISLTFTT